MLRNFSLILFIQCVFAGWGVAADPFMIDLSREGDGSNLMVSVQITIPEKHHIYADQVRVESESGVRFRPAGGDQPVPVHDSFSEGVRLSFTNTVLLKFRSDATVRATESLKVSYQGCDEAQCFG